MPKLTRSNPSYRKHRASGQAVVTIDGTDHYLGPHGTKASRDEYDRLIALWLAGGRRLAAPASDVTIVEMLAAFRRFAVKHYRRDGKPTRSLDNILDAARPLLRLFGRELVRNFGPLKLKAVQSQMVRDGLSRKVVNARLGKVKRVFKWAVSEEIAPPELAHALASVEGLQAGRTDAHESPPVRPVDDAIVDATLDHMPTVVADMVRFQRLTGARPGEVCIVRPCDIDRSDEVWMGYGITGDAQLTGQPGDGGIDGVIREDKLGLDIVCIQAKRYGEASVGRPAIQQFSGSMDGVKAKKGVVLTTSSFSRDAITFVDRIEGKRVVLIDGDQLAELMIQHNIGVTTTETYELKALSGDFFDEDEG